MFRGEFRGFGQPREACRNRTDLRSASSNGRLCRDDFRFRAEEKIAVGHAVLARLVPSGSTERCPRFFCSSCDCGSAGSLLGRLQVSADRAVRKHHARPNQTRPALAGGLRSRQTGSPTHFRNRGNGLSI